MDLSQSMSSAPDIVLHDIKPLVDITDYSIYYFSALVVVVVAVIIAALFFGWKYWTHKNHYSLRKEHSQLLHNIDFSNPKAAAYAISKYGYTFRDDDRRHFEAYENLLARLAPYKYKKSVDAIDEETRGYYDIYIGMIDV